MIFCISPLIRVRFIARYSKNPISYLSWSSWSEICKLSIVDRMNYELRDIVAIWIFAAESINHTVYTHLHSWVCASCRETTRARYIVSWGWLIDFSGHYHKIWRFANFQCEPKHHNSHIQADKFWFKIKRPSGCYLKQAA